MSDYNFKTRVNWDSINVGTVDLGKGVVVHSTTNDDSVKPSSPKLPSRNSLPPTKTIVTTPSGPNGENLRNSWSETSVDKEEEAPPLPPRGQNVD